MVTGRHSEFEVFAAHGLVGLVAPDLYLLSVLDDVPSPIEAKDHGGLAATMANGLDLGQVVGPGEQITAALEELSLEVRAKAVTQDGNVVFVGDISELLNLFASEKLSLA